MANKSITTSFLALSLGALLLGGCSGAGPAPETSTESSGTAVPSAPIVDESPSSDTEPVASFVESSPAEEEPASTTSEPAEPVTVMQEETCDWESEPLVPGSAGDVPSGPDDADLGAVLIGAWQHTHIDSGSGYEPVGSGTDIRFVFPSTTRILYCQDIAGILPEGENAADIELAGTDIQIAGAAPVYTVLAWTGDTMVWNNNRDDSLYLLKRR
ncbi:MAG: hypothetical protein Q4P15_05380 [Propionibacteriaceae bacterium]|nr:hypothetical protein [Propionibacteriaceae bacterium]